MASIMPMTAPAAVVLRDKRRVVDGFLRLDEVTVSLRQNDGTMTNDNL